MATNHTSIARVYKNYHDPTLLDGERYRYTTGWSEKYVGNTGADVTRVLENRSRGDKIPVDPARVDNVRYKSTKAHEAALYKNQWTMWVKKYAHVYGLKYAEAMCKAECKSEYIIWHNNGLALVNYVWPAPPNYNGVWDGSQQPFNLREERITPELPVSSPPMIQRVDVLPPVPRRHRLPDRPPIRRGGRGPPPGGAPPGGGGGPGGGPPGAGGGVPPGGGGGPGGGPPGAGGGVPPGVGGGPGGGPPGAGGGVPPGAGGGVPPGVGGGGVPPGDGGDPTEDINDEGIGSAFELFQEDDDPFMQSEELPVPPVMPSTSVSSSITAIPIPSIQSIPFVNRNEWDSKKNQQEFFPGTSTISRYTVHADLFNNFGTGFVRYKIDRGEFEMFQKNYTNRNPSEPFDQYAQRIIQIQNEYYRIYSEKLKSRVSEFHRERHRITITSLTTLLQDIYVYILKMKKDYEAQQAEPSSDDFENLAELMGEDVDPIPETDPAKERETAERNIEKMNAKKKNDEREARKLEMKSSTSVVPAPDPAPSPPISEIQPKQRKKDAIQKSKAFSQKAKPIFITPETKKRKKETPQPIPAPPTTATTTIPTPNVRPKRKAAMKVVIPEDELEEPEEDEPPQKKKQKRIKKDNSVGYERNIRNFLARPVFHPQARASLLPSTRHLLNALEILLRRKKDIDPWSLSQDPKAIDIFGDYFNATYFPLTEDLASLKNVQADWEINFFSNVLHCIHMIDLNVPNNSQMNQNILRNTILWSDGIDLNISRYKMLHLVLPREKIDHNIFYVTALPFSPTVLIDSLKSFDVLSLDCTNDTPVTAGRRILHRAVQKIQHSIIQSQSKYLKKNPSTNSKENNYDRSSPTKVDIAEITLPQGMRMQSLFQQTISRIIEEKLTANINVKHPDTNKFIFPFLITDVTLVPIQVNGEMFQDRISVTWNRQDRTPPKKKKK